MTMNSDKTVTANFISISIQYTLTIGNPVDSGTIISNPPGIDCGADCIETFDVNTVVTLTQVPDTGYMFTNTYY
jgi:hypothetical protein